MTALPPLAFLRQHVLTPDFLSSRDAGCPYGIPVLRQTVPDRPKLVATWLVGAPSSSTMPRNRERS